MITDIPANTEEEELYKENIIDHYKNPRNKRKMDDCAIEHKELNPLCGDEITVFIDVDKEKVIDASFQGQGCAISQASISMLTDKLKGMSITEAQTLQREDILEMLGIPVGPVRMKCALLSLKTVVRGIEECTQ